MLYIPKD